MSTFSHTRGSIGGVLFFLPRVLLLKHRMPSCSISHDFEKHAGADQSHFAQTLRALPYAATPGPGKTSAE